MYQSDMCLVSKRELAMLRALARIATRAIKAEDEWMELGAKTNYSIRTVGSIAWTVATKANDEINALRAAVVLYNSYVKYQTQRPIPENPEIDKA